MTDERWLGVLDAVAKAAHWQPREPGGARGRARARIATGRGIALGTHTSSYAAAVADIEVDRTPVRSWRSISTARSTRASP
jgi:hypothetical protein